jgi:GT2 family glycosyltransferase
MTFWSLTCYVLGLTYIAPGSPIFSPESYGGWKRDTVRNVDIVSGSLFMIDRALWNQLGGFDPAFFMYGDEADLCFRARQVGARPIVTPDATIEHYEGASAPSAMEQRLMGCKGKVTLIYRHWSPIGRLFGRMLFLLIPVTRWWGYSLAAQLSGRRDFTRLAGEWRMLGDVGESG